MLLIGKIGLSIFWGLFLLSFWPVMPDQPAFWLQWVGVVFLGIHALELVWFTRRFGDQLSDPKLEKLQVLLFGFLHWLPRWQAQRY